MSTLTQPGANIAAQYNKIIDASKMVFFKYQNDLFALSNDDGSGNELVGIGGKMLLYAVGVPEYRLTDMIPCLKITELNNFNPKSIIIVDDSITIEGKVGHEEYVRYHYNGNNLLHSDKRWFSFKGGIPIENNVIEVRKEDYTNPDKFVPTTTYTIVDNTKLESNQHSLTLGDYSLTMNIHNIHYNFFTRNKNNTIKLILSHKDTEVYSISITDSMLDKNLYLEGVVISDNIISYVFTGSKTPVILRVLVPSNSLHILDYDIISIASMRSLSTITDILFCLKDFSVFSNKPSEIYGLQSVGKHGIGKRWVRQKDSNIIEMVLFYSHLDESMIVASRKNDISTDDLEMDIKLIKTGE